MQRTRTRVGVAWLAAAAAVATLALLGGPAGATNLSGALIESPDCLQNLLPRNDDGSTDEVALPFPVNFFGREYGGLWINNNGNVTFDGPLWTYTPFGLAGTNSVIIAPFFADVDTRGTGSDVVRYGWGVTLYQGQRAFCVNWVDVGYYNSRYDKLNSFQLLLVERPDAGPGDFDIVFNYGSIQWETGDASGGSGGLGGSSARVGYSNGDGQIGTSFELDGSGRNGAFLDGNATFGLIHRSFGSTQTGRFVFPVRNGAPPPDEYVALGDSFQAGVGAGDYFPETDRSGENECLRSPNAYAPRLVADGAVPFRLDFVACSGARIHHLYESGPTTAGPPWNEDAQLDHLGERTALATVGIGGNDLGFGPRLSDCILKHFIFESCESAYDDDVTEALLALYRRDEGGLNRLQQVFADIRFRAWRGTALALGYPRFFPLEGGWDWWSSGLLIPRCQNIRVSDQLWVNHKITQLNTAIRASAESVGVRYVDIYDASAGHELCAGSPGFLNGITLSRVVESFHPTAYGHGVIAGRIATALQSGPFGDVFTIGPGETVLASYEIGAGQESATFSTTWPGSDVVMSLVSPGGRVIERSTVAPDVQHRVGPTQELYVVEAPEPGTWTVRLFGASVQPGGEPTTLVVREIPRPNADPIARLAVSQNGTTVTLDASGSTDPDGDPLQFLWELDDGAFATGARVTHTYAGAGTYRITLVAADDRGGMGFATADHSIVVSAYAFEGFLPPVANQPALNVVNAGRAIPVKFRLGGDRGLDVLAAGFPRSEEIDCDSSAPLESVEETGSAGASGLTYDPSTGTYTYVWKTEPSWAGTCRRLVVALDDGSRHAADFRFR